MDVYKTITNEMIHCQGLLKKKMCQPGQCNGCDRHDLLKGMVDSLPPIERLELEQYMRSRMRAKNDLERMVVRNRRINRGLVITFVLLAILFFGLAAKVSASPSGGTYYVNDKMITSTLKATRRKVYDRDGDGKVNCIDYTLTFKKEWDKKYPPRQCEIVRNYNVTNKPGMNHLFVRVRLSPFGEWLYIEPQAYYTRHNYKMVDYWGYPKYDPLFNNYGETRYWMGECIR